MMDVLYSMRVAQNELENIIEDMQKKLNLSDLAMSQVITMVDSTLHRRKITKEGYTMWNQEMEAMNETESTPLEVIEDVGED